MQLTGPLFLFLFLPLSVLLVLPANAKWRPRLLTVVSLLWYVLANRRNPFGILTVVLLAVFAAGLAFIDSPRGTKVRFAMGTLLPLTVWLSARVLGEYGLLPFAYPAGLTFVTLAAISVAFDRYRGDAPRPRDVFEILGYLLFFPALTMGPFLCYRRARVLFAENERSFANVSYGIRCFMGGFIKRVALAAMLLRVIDRVLSFGQGKLPVTALPFLLILSFFLFYFFFSGCSDLSRGVAHLFGVRLPRDRGVVLFATDPARMLSLMFRSLHVYIGEYVVRPVREKVGGTGGRVLSAVLAYVVLMCFYRTRPEVLLFGVPFLVFAILRAVRRRPFPTGGNRAVRVLCTLFSAACVAWFGFVIALPDPLSCFTRFGAISAGAHTYLFYYVFGTVSGSRYLLAGAIAVALFVPLSRYRHLMVRRAHGRVRTVWLALETTILFAVFALSLVYYLPQFPQYADAVSVRLLF